MYNTMIKDYLDKKETDILKKMNTILYIKNIDYMVKTLEWHISNEKSLSFQKYYNDLMTTNITNKRGFFREFKSQYSLQGIDNEYLAFLEKRKHDIISDINNGHYVNVYITYFEKAKIKHKNESRKKELGSFYTKLLNAVKPDAFCALDNPIKNYFGLKNDGFVISFCIVNEAYRRFIEQNGKLLLQLRKRVAGDYMKNNLDINNFKDMKLLDLIFWYEANVNNKRP